MIVKVFLYYIDIFMELKFIIINEVLVIVF